MKKKTKLLSLMTATALTILPLSACSGSSSSSSSTAGTNADSSSAAAAISSKTAESAAAQAESANLNISAAASLTESLKAIQELYQKKNPNVNLTFNFASSGNLQKQIEAGATVDLFISAATKQMDALKKKDLILQDTAKNLLVNKVVLIVPANSSKTLTGFQDCLTDKVSSIALGDPGSVPVGQYSQQVFTYLKGWDTVKKKASLASDVKQVLSWVETGNTDCGIVYATDAATANGKVKVVAEAPVESYKKAVYPAALVKGTKNRAAAQAFLDYLSSDEAKQIFTKNGFSIA